MTYAPLRRVPQDINPDSSTQDVQMSGKFPKVDKTPTPNAEKTTRESSEPPSLGGA
jgi:hypothetical protein